MTADVNSGLKFPIYSIITDPKNIKALDKNPYANTYYPATFLYNGIVIDCSIRYRGATSRVYSKKSWKIKFENDNNIFQAEELNLNAEYIDKTFLRNYLTNRLFAYFNLLSPECSHINLIVKR